MQTHRRTTDWWNHPTHIAPVKYDATPTGRPPDDHCSQRGYRMGASVSQTYDEPKPQPVNIKKESRGSKIHPQPVPSIPSDSSSSASDSSSDDDGEDFFDHSRRSDASQQRRKQKGAPPAKLPKFKGTVGEWENFEFQFSNVARLYKWDRKQKLRHLTSCLADKAVSFVRTLSKETRRDYKSLRSRLRERFAGTERPEIIRKDLHDVKQKVDEPLDEYADRVQTLVTRAFPGADGEFVDVMGTEIYLRGARDRQSAFETAKSYPSSISQALRGMKSSTALIKSVLGRTHTTSARQVSFQDDLAMIRAVSPHRPEVRTKQSVSVQVTPPRPATFQSSRPNSPGRRPFFQPGSPRSPARRARPMHDRCFHCNEPGHFRANCPHLINSPKANEQQ